MRVGVDRLRHAFYVQPAALPVGMCYQQDDSLIPLNEVLGFVEEGLKRYDEYRAGDASWTPYNDGRSTSHTLAELPSSDLEPISSQK
eukprot:scaffold31912_cov72-Skeletonema_dohrnii-CCMP3373.AAC.1